MPPSPPHPEVTPPPIVTTPIKEEVHETREDTVATPQGSAKKGGVHLMGRRRQRHHYKIGENKPVIGLWTFVSNAFTQLYKLYCKMTPILYKRGVGLCLRIAFQDLG